MKSEEPSKIGDLFIVTPVALASPCTRVGIDVIRVGKKRGPGARVLDIGKDHWGFVNTRKAGWNGVSGVLIALADKGKHVRG